MLSRRTTGSCVHSKSAPLKICAHPISKMQQDYPDEWCVWLSMGDVMARTANYEEAKKFYRKAPDTMAPPRYVDGLESIAQICELQGDIPGAIAAFQEELEVYDKEWHFHHR